MRGDGVGAPSQRMRTHLRPLAGWEWTGWWGGVKEMNKHKARRERAERGRKDNTDTKQKNTAAAGCGARARA